MKLYIIWSIIYIPLAVYGYVLSETGLARSVLEYVYGFFIRGEHYNSWMLWYLLATFYSLCVIYFLLDKSIKLPGIILIGFIIMCISFIIEQFVLEGISLAPHILFLLKIILDVFRRMLGGVFYIAVGMWIVENKLVFKKIYVILCVALIVVAGIKNLKIIDFIFTIYLNIGLFVSIKEVKFKDSVVYAILRKSSLCIYLIHMYVYTIYCLIVYGEMKYGSDVFIMVSLFSVIISLIYSICKKDNKGYLLNS